VDERARLAHNRALWRVVNEQFTDADAPARWADPDISWGLFRRPEGDLGLLGDLRGRDVVELGCGSAYLSAGLARAGARVIAVDLSRAQLTTARRAQDHHGPAFPLVEADAERVPLRDRSFDLVVSEYGAAPWCDPVAWLAEAARLLRRDGRLVFLTNSVLVGLCVPADEGLAVDRLLRPQRELARVSWPGGGVEHPPSHGEWVGHLTRAGFVVDALHELYAPADADDPDYYLIADARWAARWPVEDVWVAHLAGGGDSGP
jgi:SAM-dependent methyltransferase